MPKLYLLVSEDTRKRAATMIQRIKDGTYRQREDPTITRCRNLDESTEFSEEKAIENFKKICDSPLMNKLMKGNYR